MILQLHITSQELITFFEGMGYECRKIETASFTKRTHGPGDVVMIPTDHVLIRGGFVPANKLMNEYVRMSILNPGQSATANVDQAARNLVKPISKNQLTKQV